jgi:hypothetical protein
MLNSRISSWPQSTSARKSPQISRKRLVTAERVRVMAATRKLAHLKSGSTEGAGGLSAI